MSCESRKARGGNKGKVGGILYHGQRVNKLDIKKKLRRAAALCKVCDFGIYGH